MQNAERQRLVSTMSHEPAHALASVLKCGICLALLVLLAVIGGYPARDTTPQEARNAMPRSAAATKAFSAEAHRKEVLDERRAKFAGHESDPGAADLALAARVDVVAP